jgi:hypothetical protein
MRRWIFALAACALIASGSPAIGAAAKAGGKCTKPGVIARSGPTTLVCTKTGKRLVWVKKAPLSVSLPTSKPTPAPTPTPTPSTFPTATDVYWGAPKSGEEIVNAAVKAFDDWAATTRSTVEITWRFAPETPPELEKWIRGGIPFVAERLPSFKIPNKYSVITASDVDTYIKFMTEIYGASTAESQRRLFIELRNMGATAVAGPFTNVWDLKNMADADSMVTNPIGMKQTPAHEFFHIYQLNASGCGSCIPQWFMEGPAQYMGLNTARALQYADWSALRQRMLDRYRGNSYNMTLPLKEVTANDGKKDPYAIGFAATEFLVAKIGVERFVNIYVELGKGKTLDGAFRAQAGIGLDEFFAAFENARGVMGFARTNP